MKKQLSLFLISLTLLSIFSSYNSAEYLKFVQQEEVDMKYHYFGNNYPNVYSNDSPLENSCITIYNTERNDTKRNKYDIEGFKFETDIYMVHWPHQQNNIVIKVLDSDIGNLKSDNLSDVNTIENCQTIGSYYAVWTFKHYRISCSIRNFKKENSIAICSWNRYLQIYQQRHLITVSGFVNKKSIKK